MTQDHESLIAVSDVSLDLGGRRIFDHMQFDVKSGEFVAILGPNGAGKSTLLKMLLGLIEPAKGNVAVLGKSPRRGNPDIGYAPQHRVLEADLALRARDVVGFGIDGNRWGFAFPSHARTARVNAALKEVDAYHLAEKPVGALSGGEQQRLLIAQALITDPKILLLDEPLSNLDLSHAQEIVALLDKVCRERKVAIMLVAHDVNPLIGSVNRVLYLARGHSAMGSPEEVITTENLSKLYGAQVEVIRSGGRLFVVGAEV